MALTASGSPTAASRECICECAMAEDGKTQNLLCCVGGSYDAQGNFTISMWLLTTLDTDISSSANGSLVQSLSGNGVHRDQSEYRGLFYKGQAFDNSLFLTWSLC